MPSNELYYFSSYRLVQNHLEDPGIDGRIIMRWIFRRWDGGMGWIDLVQNRDRWLVVVNAIINLGFP
jgi:hypothetical protein